VSAYRALNYGSGRSIDKPSTAVNAVFLSNDRDEGTVNFRGFAGCGSAIGVPSAATRQCMGSTIEILLLGAGDEAILGDVAPDVFDDPVQPQLAAEFLADPRHHLAVARESGRIVGFASAVHYVHPDKPPELWVNEVGVAKTHQRRGLATRLLRALFDAGRSVGCKQAWVLTDRSNTSAIRLYTAVGGVEAPGQTVMFEFALDAAGMPPIERRRDEIC
jgi:ribosomal protein S18 acetylase RimI-like enzyme